MLKRWRLAANRKLRQWEQPQLTTTLTKIALGTNLKPSLRFPFPITLPMRMEVPHPLIGISPATGLRPIHPVSSGLTRPVILRTACLRQASLPTVLLTIAPAHLPQTGNWVPTACPAASPNGNAGNNGKRSSNNKSSSVTLNAPDVLPNPDPTVSRVRPKARLPSVVNSVNHARMPVQNTGRIPGRTHVGNPGRGSPGLRGLKSPSIPPRIAAGCWK